MNDKQYGELLQAIVDLRQATEHGFSDVDRRFDQQEERWNRRFNALESRVEDGFRGLDQRFCRLEDRFDRRFDRLEERVDGLDLRITGLA